MEYKGRNQCCSLSEIMETFERLKIDFNLTLVSKVPDVGNPNLYMFII